MRCLWGRVGSAWQQLVLPFGSLPQGLLQPLIPANEPLTELVLGWPGQQGRTGQERFLGLVQQ